MQALTYVGPEHVEWREVPEPELGSGRAALVRPVVAATCDLDRAIVHGLTPFPGPFTLGHEGIADVVAIGDGVAAFRPGDRVVLPFQISCGECAFCRRSLPANCTSVPRASMYGTGAVGGDWGGVFADLVHVPYADHMLVPFPPGIDPFAAASASDNLADAWRSVGPPLRERPGAPVLIANGGPAGSIGLYAAMIAGALGAGQVDLYDRDEQRCEVAARIGATPHHVREWPRRAGAYPITVDASLEAAGLALALRSTEPGGLCTGTSLFFQTELPVPIVEMYMKGITFRTGRTQARAVIPEVLAFLAERRIDPTLVTSETAPWSDAPEALLSYTTKLVLHREEAPRRHATRADRR
jgi:alcohol dehydrogenase